MQAHTQCSVADCDNGFSSPGESPKPRLLWESGLNSLYNGEQYTRCAHTTAIMQAHTQCTDTCRAKSDTHTTAIVQAHNRHLPRQERHTHDCHREAHTQCTDTYGAKSFSCSGESSKPCCTHTTAIGQAHTQCTGTYGAKSFSSSGESSKPCFLNESGLNFRPALCLPRAALSAMSLHSRSQLSIMTALRTHECHDASTHTQCSVTCRAKIFSIPGESSNPRSVRESGLSCRPCARDERHSESRRVSGWMLGCMKPKHYSIS